MRILHITDLLFELVENHPYGRYNYRANPTYLGNQFVQHRSYASPPANVVSGLHFGVLSSELAAPSFSVYYLLHTKYCLIEDSACPQELMTRRHGDVETRGNLHE